MMLLTVLVSALALCTVDATSCKECMKMQVTADDAFMQLILQTMFDAISDPNCDDNPGSVGSVNCPGAGSKCVALDTNADMSVETMFGDTVNVDLNMVVRGCLNEGEDTFNTATGCHDVADIEDELIASMEMGEETTVNSMSGDYCVCEGNNCNDD